MRLFLFFLPLLTTVFGAPQSSGITATDCGLNPGTGLPRQPGDSWSPDGCNNCRCLNSGVPGCTKRFCDLQPGEPKRCSEGARWEDKTGNDRRICHCLEGQPICDDLIVITEPTIVPCTDDKGDTRPVGDIWLQGDSTCTCRPGFLVSCKDIEIELKERVKIDLQCGVDGDGNNRDVGDVWIEQCNRCRCSSTGRPACTKKLCPIPIPVEEKLGCEDKQGDFRKEDETWEIDGEDTECECNKGLILCKDIIKPMTKPFGMGDLGIPETESINFPDLLVDGKPLYADSGKLCGHFTCDLLCQKGEVCTATGIQCVVGPCCEAWQCKVPNLLREVTEKDLTDVVQCNQGGVEKCTAVSGDLELIKGLKSGAKLNLLAGTILMELSSDPTPTSSGGISLAFNLDDGGQGNIVVGATGSMYGSINPNTGETIYALEACSGQGCNVLLERNKGYFNQFED